MNRLVKWSPLMEMEDFDKFFERAPFARMEGFAPAMDVYEKGSDMVVEMPIAGFDEKNIDISIEDNVLTVKGKTEKKSEVDDKDYYQKEVRYGSFQNSYAFPCEVEGDKAAAEYKKGVLKLTVPKKQPKEKKKKSVKVEVKE